MSAFKTELQTAVDNIQSDYGKAANALAAECKITATLRAEIKREAPWIVEVNAIDDLSELLDLEDVDVSDVVRAATVKLEAMALELEKVRKAGKFALNQWIRNYDEHAGEDSSDTTTEEGAAIEQCRQDLEAKP